MRAKDSRPAENWAAEGSRELSQEEVKTLSHRVVEFDPDPEHEARLRVWVQGWDACAAYLQPQLDQALADRDRYFRRAFDSPEQLRERLDQGASDYWSELLESEGQVGADG